MKEKIIAYLSGPRPYREGIALYEEYGLNLMLKATFRRNAETDLLRATLMEELRKLAGISETAFRTMQRKAVDSPHISSASIVVEEIKAEKTAVNVPVTPVVENVIRFRDRFPFLNSPDCPDVLKILVADMFTAYDLYLKTFRELGELIGINDTWIRRRFAIKDCNTAIAGAYNVDDSTTNNFPTGAYKFGTLLVANSGFFGSQYFVPDNFNVDPYIYIRSISNNGNSFNKWAKIKVTIIT